MYLYLIYYPLLRPTIPILYLFTDTSSFGRKMLEKMGWKTGQGLGLNNDGTTTHIKISVKDDNLGIGASQKDAETGWLNNSKSYQEVLDRLAQSMGKEAEEVESERKKDKKSKKSKDDKESKKSKKDKKDKKDAKVSKKKSEKSKESKESKKSKESKESQKAPTILKSAHRAKFIRNKAVSSYSEAHLKEILGGINI